jgi:nucleotide-binding universal stress UspA family protein
MRAADLKEWDECGFVHDTVGSAVARVIATEGSVVPEILSAAERGAADLIVLCTCGSSGFEGCTSAR